MSELGVRLRLVSVHHGVEAGLPVGRVVHGTYGAIRFHQAVLALDHVTIALLPLALHVAGVRVVHCILERVPGVVVLHKRKLIATYVLFFCTKYGNNLYLNVVNLDIWV